MNIWKMSPKLRAVLVDGINGELWDDATKEEHLFVVNSIEDVTVICDDEGARDANGDIVHLDDMPEEFIPHPVQMIEYYGVAHVADATEAELS